MKIELIAQKHGRGITYTSGDLPIKVIKQRRKITNFSFKHWWNIEKYLGRA